MLLLDEHTSLKSLGNFKNTTRNTNQSLTQFWAFESFSACDYKAVTREWKYFENRYVPDCQCKIKLAFQRIVVTVHISSSNLSKQCILGTVCVPHKIFKKLFPFQLIYFYNGDLCLLWVWTLFLDIFYINTCIIVLNLFSETLIV